MFTSNSKDFDYPAILKFPACNVVATAVALRYFGFFSVCLFVCLSFHSSSFVAKKLSGRTFKESRLCSKVKLLQQANKFLTSYLFSQFILVSGFYAFNLWRSWPSFCNLNCVGSQYKTKVNSFLQFCSFVLLLLFFVPGSTDKELSLVL